MKKILVSTFFAMVGLCTFAQSLPQDPAVRVGRLDNGLTYYLRHNAKEAGLADFYIAQ